MDYRFPTEIVKLIFSYWGGHLAFEWIQLQTHTTTTTSSFVHPYHPDRILSMGNNEKENRQSIKRFLERKTHSMSTLSIMNYMFFFASFAKNMELVRILHKYSEYLFSDVPYGCFKFAIILGALFDGRISNHPKSKTEYPGQFDLFLEDCPDLVPSYEYLGWDFKNHLVRFLSYINPMLLTILYKECFQHVRLTDIMRQNLCKAKMWTFMDQINNWSDLTVRAKCRKYTFHSGLDLVSKLKFAGKTREQFIELCYEASLDVWDWSHLEMNYLLERDTQAEGKKHKYESDSDSDSYSDSEKKTQIDVLKNTKEDGKRKYDSDSDIEAEIQSDNSTP